ncbi:hypothetical protein EDD11_000757 [Mortierella claussenii]|nr:hypothetical protein EDD11_000757 [Mortierella claussenii]
MFERDRLRLSSPEFTPDTREKIIKVMEEMVNMHYTFHDGSGELAVLLVSSADPQFVNTQHDNDLHAENLSSIIKQLQDYMSQLEKVRQRLIVLRFFVTGMEVDADLGALVVSVAETAQVACMQGSEELAFWVDLEERARDLEDQFVAHYGEPTTDPFDPALDE